MYIPTDRCGPAIIACCGLGEGTNAGDATI